MKIRVVRDIDFDSERHSRYDLGIFSSGFERRSSYIASKLSLRAFARILVLGFSANRDIGARAANDEFYIEHWRSPPVLTSAADDGGILSFLRENLAKAGPVRLLVDYTSMSRTWYSAVLNWARFGAERTNIEIDFVYAPGDYQGPYPPRVISDIKCISGCEGNPDPTSRSVAIFGLGYDGLSPLAILDYLEPDDVFAFIASPGVAADSESRALSINSDLISQIGPNLIKLPLLSVQSIVGGLSELVSPFMGAANVVIIPLGPKSHVLGAVLTSMRFEDVACLHVSGNAQAPLSVEAAGSISAARVEFVPDETALMRGLSGL